MNYLDKLKESAGATGNILSMGLDPIPSLLPGEGNIETRIVNFFLPLFEEMKKRDLVPASFKPNLGYFSALDRPRQGEFQGSKALAHLLDKIGKIFPDSLIILDSKRGDIARSSLNYGIEAFDCWKAHAVTVSPWMGSDSIIPFCEEGTAAGGVYLLNRTSNPGGGDLQKLTLEGGKKLYMETASLISQWAKSYRGIGAVVGATSPDELEDLARFYSSSPIPLLIPGVGSQGGSMKEVREKLNSCSYEEELVRINVSSQITHPWGKKGKVVPENWLEVSLSNLKTFIEGASLDR